MATLGQIRPSPIDPRDSGSVAFPDTQEQDRDQQLRGQKKKEPGARNFEHLGVNDEDRRELLQCIRLYRDSWMTNRLELFRIWTRNDLFRKGVQCLGWDPNTLNWFDALSWYRETGQARDGEDTDLEPFITNVTLTCSNTFTGILTGAIPRSQVTPKDSRIPKDVKAVKAVRNALDIISHMNGGEQLMLEGFESQYSFGCYFRHVRAVFDGDTAGYDEQAFYEDFEVRPPARMKCMRCGTETPISQIASGTGTGQMPQCPNCGTQMGPESLYGEGEGAYKSLKMAGVRQVPRAMVRESIHDPREIDMDPKAKKIRQTGIFAREHEIDIGEAREMFPDLCDKIQEGATSPTSANAEYERLRRLEGYSAAGTQTSDLNQSSVTYSEVWMQPRAFYRTGKQDFAERMKKAFPQGLMIANLGEETTEIRPAILVREWTHCGLQRGFGVYSPAIAERVVPFNKRINTANQLVDGHAQTGSLGLNVARASSIDTQKISGVRNVPQTVIPIPDKVNGEAKPIGEIFAHYDTPMAAEMWTYPQALYTFLMLVAELPPQVNGGGTQEGVDTFGGQQQSLNRALTIFRRYWMNAKREATEADENKIYWLKKLMKAGAIRELWDVNEEAGGNYQNKSVSAADLDGDCKFKVDEAQDIPTTPEELREAIIGIFTSLNNQNPAAAEWFDDLDNQQMAISSMVPGSSAPNEAQRLKTLGDLAKLAELQLAPQPVQGPDGQQASPPLPFMPVEAEDLDIAEKVCARFIQDNADRQYDGTPAWQWWQLYYDAILDVNTQKKVKAAGRQLRVQAASQPAPASPDPTLQAEMQQLIGVAGPAIQRLLQLAQTDPMLTKGTATAQVSAAKEIVDTTVDAAKLAAGGK